MKCAALASSCKPARPCKCMPATPPLHQSSTALLSNSSNVAPVSIRDMLMISSRKNTALLLPCSKSVQRPTSRESTTCLWKALPKVAPLKFLLRPEVLRTWVRAAAAAESRPLEAVVSHCKMMLWKVASPARHACVHVCVHALRVKTYVRARKETTRVSPLLACPVSASHTRPTPLFHSSRSCVLALVWDPSHPNGGEMHTCRGPGTGRKRTERGKTSSQANSLER